LDTVIESGYFCATSNRFEVLWEVQMPRWFRFQTGSQIERFLQSKCACPTAVVLALFLPMPIATLAQGSSFDTGFTAIQSIFTGTIAKVASLVTIVIAGYGLMLRRPDFGSSKAFR
jgi:type IV secretory pathway VirB2 component (pilin)